MEIKSSFVTCPNGHYYNPSVHSACPYCGAVSTEVSGGATAGNFVPTEAPNGGVFGGAPAGNFVPTEAPNGGAFNSGAFPPTETPFSAVPNANPVAPMAPTSPVTPWTSNASAVNPFDVKTQIGGDTANAGQVTPVVGWLVCIDGPVRGTDWRLHAGYNYIGRETGDVHIQGDNQISREKHALIAYHNANRIFYVGPAEGRNIIEVNGEPIFNATKLNAYDIITIGTTRLIFVPLCGPKFNWEQPDQRD